ncbi:hypothetical protein QI051_03610 [Staphylococcus saprophyticus]|nr:hypothetical protein [Staphylococcus saprophyticus]MDW4434521.1 hypothetical protein [Staphylococcus saprophyticus]
MVKIKQKKQLNLPQLIEWAWDNDIKNETFIADKQLTNIEFDDTGDVLIYGNDNKKTVKFSIEVEEEITEDTVIPKMLVKFKNPDTYGRFKNDSINGFEIEEGNLEAFYIINDDLTMTLIWRDGKLIEE